MEEKKGEIPNVLYLYIHSRIWEAFKNDNVAICDVYSYLHEWKIPKRIRPLIIKEFELLDLIEKSGRYTLLIKRPCFKLDDCNVYYKKLNIF